MRQSQVAEKVFLYAIKKTSKNLWFFLTVSQKDRSSHNTLLKAWVRDVQLLAQVFLLQQVFWGVCQQGSIVPCLSLLAIAIARPFCKACVWSWRVNPFPELAHIDVHTLLASWKLCSYEILSRKFHFRTETRCTLGLPFRTLWGLFMMGRLRKLALEMICKRKQDLKPNSYLSLDFTIIQFALIHLLLGLNKSSESEICLLLNKEQL